MANAEVQSTEPDLSKLHEAALRAKTAEQTYRDAVLIRDQLVVQAVDEGHRVAQVAGAALMARSRVLQIVAARG